jgi:glycosyltransferase involved in cell wall biosynthesis
MIRVAHLLPNMVTGGRERIVADLCAHAAAADIEPMVITYDPPPPEAAQVDLGDTPVYALDRRDPAFTARLRERLRESRIDVLHAQGHVPAALARPALGHVPMLATLHIALGGGWRWALPVARGLRAAAAVTAVSDDLARRFRPLANRPIATIPTGVDLDRFAPAPDRVNRADFTIGIAARLHPVKRHEDAIAACRILQHRGVRYRLRIAGQGAEAARLTHLARGLNVTFDGNVAAMPAWLASLDAFLLVSDHEGTPAALLEAMACGLPCIATNVGGVPTLVQDTALLVPRRTPTAIADAIQHLAADQALRMRLGTAARQRAAHYSATAQAAGYAEIYGNLADSRHIATLTPAAPRRRARASHGPFV